jgi:hypothetical protein
MMHNIYRNFDSQRIFLGRNAILLFSSQVMKKLPQYLVTIYYCSNITKCYHCYFADTLAVDLLLSQICSKIDHAKKKKKSHISVPSASYRTSTLIVSKFVSNYVNYA